ncbi:uncharacterized protein LOC143009962 [Genypterus blacodes]|uniref:uncharacterized protein LOC143009962 n=1 Tax=Genypterus blacodes TaxID=154954 RepID=UPI003F76D497
MASLSWLMVASSLLLIAGNCVGAVDQNRLAQVVKAVRKQYAISGQFSLVANIPLSQFTDRSFNPYDLMKMIKPNTNALNDINDGRVYKGDMVVVAKPELRKHSELRVLEEISDWDPKGNFLLIYSYLSSCGGQCTNPKNPFNILGLIENCTTRWEGNLAFVFTKVFDRTRAGDCIEVKDSIRALKNLANASLGMNNIFHCYRPENEFLCSTCSSGGEIADHCIDNNVAPQQGRSTGQSSSRRRRSLSIEQDSSSSGGRGGRNECRTRSKERREGPRVSRDPSPERRSERKERRDQNREHRARSKERRDGPRQRRGERKERRNPSRSLSRSGKSKHKRRSNKG